MGKPRIIAGIDVGSTKICALVAEAIPGGVNLLAASAVAAAGIQRGAVVDLERATAAIGRSLDQVAADSRVKIGGVLLAIGTEAASLNCRGTSLGASAGLMLTASDASGAILSAIGGRLPPTRQVIHSIPRSFSVDGRPNVANPVGLYGRRIDAEVHTVTTDGAAVQSLVSCVERSGIRVDGIVAKPLAAAEAVLGSEERELGVVVADLGGGTTGLTVFVEGTPWHTSSLPIGGRHFTQDVATVLGIGYDVAEALKLEAGHADPTAIDPDESIEIPCAAEGAPARVSRQYLCAIIEARVEQLVIMIRDELSHSGYAGLLPAGLVLTGGAAQLPGVARAAGEILGMRVRVGQSELGAGAGLGGPAYAGAIGLLLWGSGSRTRLWTLTAQAQERHGKLDQASRAARWLHAAWSPISGLGGIGHRS